MSDGLNREGFTEPQTLDDEEFAPVHVVQLQLCDPCIDGEGDECHTPGCSLWLNRPPDIGLRDNPSVTIAAPAEPQPAPELQAGEVMYLYHWRFDLGEEFGLYRHAADADARAARHADEGLSEVLSMAALGRPEQTAREPEDDPLDVPIVRTGRDVVRVIGGPATELAATGDHSACEADIASLTDQRNRVSDTADRLRAQVRHLRDALERCRDAIPTSTAAAYTIASQALASNPAPETAATEPGV
jgi:hypothetical protein